MSIIFFLFRLLWSLIPLSKCSKSVWATTIMQKRTEVTRIPSPFRIAPAGFDDRHCHLFFIIIILGYSHFYWRFIQFLQLLLLFLYTPIGKCKWQTGISKWDICLHYYSFSVDGAVTDTLLASAENLKKTYISPWC